MINMPAPTHASSASTTTSSVHSQFAALSRDRDQFQKQLESVQKQYASGQTQLQQLTAQQEELVGKIRIEQERLGTLTRQQDLLQSEQARLNRVLQNERQALQQCADHLRDTHSKHQETLQTYCRESDPIHLQSVSLLQQQLAQQELLPLVSAASLQYALQQAKQSSSTTTTTTSSSTTTSPTTVAASTSTLSNNNMTSKAILQMMETIPLEELAAAETKYQACKNSLQKLQAQVQQLRQRAVASGQLTTDDSSSDTALRRLEAQFFQDDSSTSKEQVPRRPPAMDDNSAYLSADAKANMDLFYGTQEDDADEEQQPQQQLEG